MLEQRGFTVAQVLLTLGDTEERRRYLNARNTLTTLLRLGAIPVINENDTVATAEIRYGDNDRLAARVAQMVSADCLVLLSDVDGLYTADPDARPGRAVHPGGDAHHAGDRGDGGRLGLGRRLGRHGHQGHGGEDRGARPAATSASPPARSASAAAHRVGRALHLVRGRGLAGHGAQAVDRRHAQARPANSTVDEGAARALRDGKSLLPAGVTAGERAASIAATPCVVRDPDGLEIARGLAAYSSTDAERIRGRRSSELEALLGYRGRDEMIHRDDLVLAVTIAGHRSD